MHFTRIEPTEHYLSHHAHEVPWSEVVAVIFATKNSRKKGGKYEIKDGCYVLFEIRHRTLYVINAKR